VPGTFSLASVMAGSEGKVTGRLNDGRGVGRGSAKGGGEVREGKVVSMFRPMHSRSAFSTSYQ